MIDGYFKSLFKRLGQAWGWIACQFIGLLVLLAGGIGWTRIPDKHGWQVIASLVVPVILAALMFVLQAGTMRKVQDTCDRRVKLAWGATTLLVWCVAAIVMWHALDWFNDQISAWASYFGSLANAQSRSHVFTYGHLITWLNAVEWIARWILVPGILIPCAMATSLRGFRQFWFRILLLMRNWRWWLSISAIALLAVRLPDKFFSYEPHGTVSAQIWSVGLKLVGTYLLIVICWALLLSWAAVLFSRASAQESGIDREVIARLRSGWVWIIGLFVWALACISSIHLQAGHDWPVWVKPSMHLPLMAIAVCLLTMLIRTMLAGEVKHTALILGAIALLIWSIAISTAGYFLQGICGMFTPVVNLLFIGLLAPFALASAQWGFLLPWKRVVALLCNWRWWVGAACVIVIGGILPFMIHVTVSYPVKTASTTSIVMREAISWFLVIGCMVLQAGLFAALIGQRKDQAENK